MRERKARLHSGMFTSVTDEWGTPRPFFDLLDSEFGFTLDVCATNDNAKCSTYYTPEQDGLTQPWTGVCWMNPPYGRAIATWVRRAWVASTVEGATVVCLIPARTDTAYWHDYVMKASEVRCVRGRLHFDGASDKGHNAPFPCAVVVFRPEQTATPTLRAQERSA